MKREWFRRGVRMQHQFGETEKINDPMGTQTFELPHAFFNRPGMRDLSDMPAVGPCEIQQYGEHHYREPPSPIQKPSGAMASMRGPAPDIAQIFGMPWPVGTKRRGGPPKTDK